MTLPILHLLSIAPQRTAGAWDPSDLSAVLWLRGDLGVTTSGSDVTIWANQGTAGSSADFTFAVGDRPALTSADANFNSQDTVEFSADAVGSCPAGNWWEQTSDGDDTTFVFVLRGEHGNEHQAALLHTEYALNFGGFEIDFGTGGGGGTPAGCEVIVYDVDANTSVTHTGHCAKHEDVSVLVVQFSGSTQPTNDTLDIWINNHKALSASANLDVIQSSAAEGEPTVEPQWFLGGPDASTKELNASIAEVIMFHGLLSTGTNDADLTSYLNTRYGLSLSGVADGGWSPFSLAPQGWWRADLGHAVSDGGSVSAWANQGHDGPFGSEGEGDLTQGTGANQPTFDEVHASFNSQAVMDFDGGDVIYAPASDWWHLSGTSEDCAVIAVVRNTTASGSNVVLRTRSYTTQGGMQLNHKSGAACAFNLSDGSSTLNDTGDNGTQNQTEVIAGVLTGDASPSNDTAEVFVDGSSGGSTAADLGTIAAGANREWCVGGTTTTAGSFTGQIAELIYVKRALSASEDSELSDYIDARYGTTTTSITQ